MQSLREAAKERGLSEEALRRSILLGEVEATSVDDDRQYLLPSIRPARRPGRGRLYLWCLAAWVVLGVSSALGTRWTESTCGTCGAQVRTERLFGAPMSQGRDADCVHDRRK